MPEISSENRFRDAVVHLQEAYDYLDDSVDDPDEKGARDRLIQLCVDIAGRYEDGGLIVYGEED